MMSSAENEKKNVEESTNTDDDVKTEKQEFETGEDQEGEDGDEGGEVGEDEVNYSGYYKKSDFLKIPITVAAPDPEPKKKLPAGEPIKRNGKEDTKPLQNNTKKTGTEPPPEKEIDIVEIPNFPESGPKYGSPSPRKPCHREDSCCGYRENRPPPCQSFCNQGIGCPFLSPFPAMPACGYPVMIMPAFPPMGFYGQCITNTNVQFADCYRGRGHYYNGCCYNQNLPPCCPYEETTTRDPFNETRDHCNDARHHLHGDLNGEHTSGHHHHHQEEDCCENQDPRDMENYNCEQDVIYDDAKSVEELLEEYLEDIDEKAERIHDILDEYEAMDLFISVHGFQPEEVHVTASGRILTVKGDHQYSEAMWVRVRNFSESYEIPEEFDVSRTTAVIKGESLCVRIPHVDGE